MASNEAIVDAAESQHDQMNTRLKEIDRLLSTLAGGAPGTVSTLKNHMSFLRTEIVGTILERAAEAKGKPVPAELVDALDLIVKRGDDFVYPDGETNWDGSNDERLDKVEPLLRTAIDKLSA